jgi:predicted metal-dependent hydrolase
MNIFIYDGEKIEYKVKRSKRKTIGIKISPQEGVILAVPIRCTDATIQHVLNKKASWIIKKKNMLQDRSNMLKDREFINGEKLKLLGDDIDFNIIRGDFQKCSARFDTKGFTIYINNLATAEEQKDAIKTSLNKLYREIAKKLFLDRTNYYSQILKLYPERIVIKEQKTVWGSCSSKNNINYNWRVIMAPITIVDYIVVHELCHLKYANHSKEYWQLVENIIPEYRIYRDWLKENGMKLNIEKI